MREQITVTAPSRLHFGLLPPGPNGERFGGCGVMLDRPITRVTVSRSSSWQAAGRHAAKALRLMQSWQQFVKSPADFACSVDVERAPPLHVGLGTGTQMALAIAHGLYALLDSDVPPYEVVARSCGRAQRSAIGTHGFGRGGFLVDRGRRGDERQGVVPDLDFQTTLPDSWCWVLVRPQDDQGLSGAAEKQAFEFDPADSARIRSDMTGLLVDRLVPAATQGDFTEFSRALYQYGLLAGEVFAEHQGGPFNGPAVARLVQLARDGGVQGVGQSSWGPTVFTLHEQREPAEAFARRMILASRDLDVQIAKTAVAEAAPSARDRTAHG